MIWPRGGTLSHPRRYRTGIAEVDEASRRWGLRSVSARPCSGAPYLQLVQQVEQALRLGYLKPDDQLPKVRDVVASLAINPNTVLKAYRELETKGLTAGRPGQGTFIQATLSQVALSELTALRRSLLGWLATAERAGLDADGTVALFTSVLRDFYEGRDGSADRLGAAPDASEKVA